MADTTTSPDPVDLTDEQKQAAADEAAAEGHSRQMAAIQEEAEADNAYFDETAATAAALAAANADAHPEAPLFTQDRIDAPNGSFGPSFWSELEDADADKLAFVVFSTYIQFNHDISSEDRAKVMAVVEAHDPTKPAPLPFINEISDRQFFQQLAVDNEITKAEALDAVKTGSIPAALQAVIDALPEDQKFTAEMLVSGATKFEYSNPFTEILGLAMNRTDTQMKALWIKAAAL